MNTLKLFEQAFRAYETEGLSILNRFTLRLDPSGVPDPDLLLAPYDVRTATSAIGPEDVALVLEVSVTSLREDREDKARMYSSLARSRFAAIRRRASA